MTFNADSRTTIATQAGDIGMTTTEPSTTKDGYVFDGWYFNGTKYTFDAEVNESTTLTTEWLEQYTVAFNANGGEGSMDAQIFTEGQEQALTANVFTKSGYTFAGWPRPLLVMLFMATPRRSPHPAILSCLSFGKRVH